jgi:hypothetical protein
MFLNPLLKADLVNRTFLLGTIRTLSFGGDTMGPRFDSGLKRCLNGKTYLLLLSSSTVEHSAVNRRVVGSNPT